MTLASAAPTPIRRSLRLWPAIVATGLTLAVPLLGPLVAPSYGMLAIASCALGGLLILLWWLFFSRAPWVERVGAVLVVAIATVATERLVHESLAGVFFYVVGVPLLLIALVVWAVGTRRFARGPRRAWMIPAIALAGLALTAVRFGGVSPSEGLDFEWRWTPTVEDRLLAAEVDAESATAIVAAEPTDTQHEPQWPGFRGPHRDGVVTGLRLDMDWSKSPPVEVWRHPVGPGWSSFAIEDDRLYTQEQLGEEELVTCYDLATGRPVWRHGDSARFWEAAAGPGPRATPTLHDGRVYALGATGTLNALDARDGSLVWSRNLATDAETSVPDWGFAGSPLVVGDTLVVAAAGKPVAYDLATGELRWIGSKGAGYSSPQLATIDGVDQILIINGLGASSVDPRDGRELWMHAWAGDGIVQPAVMDDGSVLISGIGSPAGGNSGIRRVAVDRASGEWSPERGADGWVVEERWTTTGLKPFFNDFVVHENHAYGFDGAILACIGLDDGARQWKGGRYGNGQLMLLPDQDLLFVLSERGEMALVDAVPAQFTERARFKAIDGKTWNHPAVAGDVVVVRNGEEMAAFRLTRASG
jgi:outer membrane protein assembly factor BamB